MQRCSAGTSSGGVPDWADSLISFLLADGIWAIPPGNGRDPLVERRGPSQRAPCAIGGKDQAMPHARSFPSPPQWASVGVSHALPFHGTRKRSLL